MLQVCNAKKKKSSKVTVNQVGQFKRNRITAATETAFCHWYAILLVIYILLCLPARVAVCILQVSKMELLKQKILFLQAKNVLEYRLSNWMGRYVAYFRYLYKYFLPWVCCISVVLNTFENSNYNMVTAIFVRCANIIPVW